MVYLILEKGKSKAKFAKVLGSLLFGTCRKQTCAFVHYGFARCRANSTSDFKHRRSLGTIARPVVLVFLPIFMTDLKNGYTLNESYQSWKQSEKRCTAPERLTSSFEIVQQPQENIRKKTGIGNVRVDAMNKISPNDPLND